MSPLPEWCAAWVVLFVQSGYAPCMESGNPRSLAARGSRLAPTRRIVGLIAHNLARVAERDT
jgi:hypothetical protein